MLPPSTTLPPQRTSRGKCPNVEIDLAKVDVCVNVKIQRANLDGRTEGDARWRPAAQAKGPRVKTRFNGNPWSLRVTWLVCRGCLRRGTLGQHPAHGGHRAVQFVDGIVEKRALLLQAGKLLFRLVQ